MHTIVFRTTNECNLRCKYCYDNVNHDEKISKKERDSQPILVDSQGTILWIPGMKKSKFDKQKEENYDIIVKYH